MPKGRNTICVFRGFSTEQVRTIRILKESQPWQEDENRFFLLHSVLCDGAVCEAVRKRRKLEFVGDSLSSGEGLSGPVELVSSCSGVFGLEGHYALRTAKALQADLRILSQSGWGVCCGWNNSPAYAMPLYYGQVCGISRGARNRELGALDDNDFDAWQPDAVVVNPGSNDGFALDSAAWVDPRDGKEWRLRADADGRPDRASAERFERAAVSFLKCLRQNNPNAWLIWAYGMIDHRMQPYLEESMRQYIEESGDEKAEFLSLPAGRAEWTGSNNHPGKRTHEAASELLIKELNKRLNPE
ncbi:MAG: GDSL family lipase [Roseburia sp.]|nr:GDSL family lipase [Roseburia sp.]